MVRLTLKVTPTGRAKLYDSDDVEVLPGLIRSVDYSVGADHFPEVRLALVKVALEVVVVEDAQLKGRLE